MPFLLFVGVLIVARPADAATSSTLNFQGRLLTSSGALVADGSYNIDFNLYAVETGGSTLWTESRTGANQVSVTNGYFSVYLGKVTAFPASIPWDQELWLTMNVEGDGEMTPRFRLTAVPYAFRSGALVTAGGDAVTADDLAQLAPTTAQTVTSALNALRINQTGGGGLLQLQTNGSDVFTVDGSGGATLGAGLTLGNSSSTTAGTIRWNGSDLQVFDGTVWQSLTSSASSATPAAATFFDASGGANVAAGGFSTINLDTTLDNSDSAVLSLSNDTVTVAESGYYEISYEVSARLAAGTRSGFTAKLQLDTGGGFSDVAGSYAYHYGRLFTEDQGTSSATVILNLIAGDVLRVQGQGVTQPFTTVANGTRLTISRIAEGSIGGSSGLSFEQNGSSFGQTGVLGTADAFGLNIITNNATALSFSSGGDATFTNGLSIQSGGLNLTGDITATSGLTIASGGSGDLTLAAASGTIVLGGDRLQRSGSGTTTIDLFDTGGTTTFRIENSDGSQVAGLSVEGGVTASSFAGAGSGLTDLNGSAISSGTIPDARLSANIARLDGANSFTQRQTLNGGATIGNTASSIAGTIRWTGADFEGYDGTSWVSLTGGGTSLLEGVVAFGTYNGSAATALALDGASVVRNAVGDYRVVFDTATTTANYTIQLTVNEPAALLDDVNISADNVSTLGFDVDVHEGDNGTAAGLRVDRVWHFIVFDSEAAAGGGSGGGSTSFAQGGNSFGATGILGTTDANGLNIVTNGANALTFTSGGAATFSGVLSAESRLLRGVATTGDAAAQALFTSGLATAKGLVVQGVSVQTANLFEVQDSLGNVLAGFDAGGGLVLGLSTLDSLATGSQTVSLPDASGTICLTGGNCGFLELASGSYATDATANTSIAINKTSTTGDLISLQRNGGAVFTVANTGSLQIQSSDNAAFDVRNVGGSSFFSVDSSSGVVRVGPATADANGVLFVLDVKNTAGDPTGVDGAQYYNADLGKFRCFEGGVWVNCISGVPQVRSFVDTIADALIDADTASYWDISVENNLSFPNIALSDASNSVMGTVSVEFVSATTANRDVVTRLERGIGAPPACGSGVVVGGKIGTYSTNTGLRRTGTMTFIDDAATTNNVFYTLCSDNDTNSANGISIGRIRVTLQEVANSNQ